MSDKKVWVIKYEVGEHRGFVMTSPEGKAHEGLKPRKLAKIAWANGADEVVHDYDLTLDKD